MKTLIPQMVGRLLGDATLLTRSGRLREATAAIQRALGGAGLAPAREPLPAAGPEAMVLDGLVRELPRAAPDAGGGSPAIDPSTARFTSGTHVAASGTRGYKLFIPAGRTGAPLPLVVMLHGCKQDPDDFAAGTRMNEVAQERGFIVLYPAQAPRSNMSKCWNWFQPGDQRRGGGEPALLAAMTRRIIAEHRVDPERVFVAGLSAGGAMSAILGREYPDLFAAVGVHSGLPAGAAHDVATAFAAMKSGAPSAAMPAPGGAAAAPMIVFHGDRDATVHPANGEQLIDGTRGTAHRLARQQRNGRDVSCTRYHAADGAVVAEHWLLHGAGHAWSGGSAAGSFTDARGPDASREMLRFFLEHPRRERR